MWFSYTYCIEKKGEQPTAMLEFPVKIAQFNSRLTMHSVYCSGAHAILTVVYVCIDIWVNI